MQQIPKEGKWTIRMGEGNTMGIIKPLIPFNCIIDSDVGLIELIRSEYRSPDMFDIGLLDSFSSQLDLLKFLYHRKSINPLIPFMINKEDNKTADDLYMQFMDKQYSEILQRSPLTGLYKLANLCNHSEEVASTISFSNDIEESIINKDPVLKRIKKVSIGDIPYNCNNLDVFFFKSTIDPYLHISIPILRSKNINILDYDYNFEEDGNLIVSKDIAIAEMSRCRFNVINAYNRQEIGEL